MKRLLSVLLIMADLLALCAAPAISAMMTCGDGEIHGFADNPVTDDPAARWTILRRGRFQTAWTAENKGEMICRESLFWTSVDSTPS